MCARLSSIEKAGYYAFPEERLPSVASLFAPASSGGRLLDPCAGEGRALQHLSAAWRLTPYANELDTDRASACQSLFGPIQAVQGDLYTLRASLGSFPAIWLNPPYTWDLGNKDDKRRELAMLKHSWKWLQASGWMMWVVYAHHVAPVGDDAFVDDAGDPVAALALFPGHGATPLPGSPLLGRF